MFHSPLEGSFNVVSFEKAVSFSFQILSQMFQKCVHENVPHNIIPKCPVERFIYIVTYIVMRRNVWTVRSPGALTKVSIAVNRYMDTEEKMYRRLFNGKINSPFLSVLSSIHSLQSYSETDRNFFVISLRWSILRKRCHWKPML